jgi:hypothetical protein
MSYISSKSSPEEYRLFREKCEPSNFDVIGAFAPSDHLKLFCVVNTAKSEQFVLASSCGNAKILSKMSGHIEAMDTGRCWSGWERAVPRHLSEKQLEAVQAAIQDRAPGVIWFKDDFVILRHGVYSVHKR